MKITRRLTLHKARPGTRNPSITPTNNQFDSLRDTDSEDTPEPVQTPKPTGPGTSTQAQRTPPVTTKVTTTATHTITEVDYSFLDTMTETTSTKTIADYLTAEDVKPITNKWTIIDISDFCTTIANALTNITSIYTDKVAKDIGHAYLVDKTLQYRKRCEGESAQLPAPQTRPVEPTNQNAYAHKQYLYHMKPYRLSRALDKEVRRLITTKFPGCLEGLLCPLTGSLSLSLTARQAFDHIEEAVQATSTGNMRHQELLQALIMREYVPGITTAEAYFRLCETDQYRIQAIGIAEVLDAQIMVGALITFCKSMDSTVMQIIDNAWAITKTASRYALATTIYRNFKAHYCKNLREYYINTKSSTRKHQAPPIAVDEITARMDQLQTKVDRNTQNVHTIANTQDQMLEQPKAYSAQFVPSLVSTIMATTPSGLANSAADMRFDKLEGSIESIVQQLRALSQNQNRQQPVTGVSASGNNNTTCRTYGDPNGPWRQWKYWCYTCGTNLSHALVNCHKTGRQKA